MSRGKVRALRLVIPTWEREVVEMLYSTDDAFDGDGGDDDAAAGDGDAAICVGKGTTVVLRARVLSRGGLGPRRVAL
jgi:hypothetical protein